MPTKPWVTFRPPDADQEYLVLLTELPLKRFRRSLLYTWRIQGQLRHAPGLLGYSLVAHVFRRQFWTLSVWTGEASLRQFVAEKPHAEVMMALSGKMEQTHFVRWSILGADFPPRWEDTLTKRR